MSDNRRRHPGPIGSALLKTPAEEVRYLFNEGDVVSVAVAIHTFMHYATRVDHKTLERLFGSYTIDRAIAWVKIYGTQTSNVAGMLRLHRAGLRWRKQSDVRAQYRRSLFEAVQGAQLAAPETKDK